MGDIAEAAVMDPYTSFTWIRRPWELEEVIPTYGTACGGVGTNVMLLLCSEEKED